MPHLLTALMKRDVAFSLCS